MKIIEITVNTKGQYRIETRGFTVGVIRKELTLRPGLLGVSDTLKQLRNSDTSKSASGRPWPTGYLGSEQFHGRGDPALFACEAREGKAMIGSVTRMSR